MSTIFQKILEGEIAADIVYEDEKAIAFKDINPQAPFHVLIIPRKLIPGVADAGEGDRELLGHLLWVAGQIALRDDTGDFRLVINNGEGAGQSVFHLHVHMLAGRELTWPPG